VALNPASIVHFRNRDWVLLPGEDPEVLLLRPLTGTSDDVVAVHRVLSDLLGYSIPSERVSPSSFPPPDPRTVADAQSVARDAKPELQRLFQTPQDAIAYIMEQFPIVRRRDEERYGSYRTKETILAVYKNLMQGSGIVERRRA
jgi:hypothetical protein